MARIEASSQSPVLINTNKAVARMPRPAKAARNRFLPRMTSETVPRIGDRMATIRSEIVRPRLQ
jgi:hypothetical protein